jgi:sugar/nucleoside kinase (ribokinase family)
MGSIFVVGGLNVDVHCSVRGVPGKGEEEHAESISFSIGGNAANFAVALGKLGVQPEFYSCIGDDFSSGFLKRSLDEAGVKANLKEVEGSNGYTVALVFRDGKRCFISNKGACYALGVRDLEPLLERIRPGDIVYTGGLFHLPGLARRYEGFLREAKKRGATLMFDFTFDETGCSGCFKRFARHLDMAFMNEDELERHGGKDSRKALKRISGLGVRDIIVKLGDRGSMFYTNSMLKREPARRVKVVDCTGAGDVFNAGFVYGFMSGLLPEKCLKLGNWAAAWTITRTGIEVPPRERVSAFMKRL